MANARLVLGIIFGILLSIFSIGAFTMWQSFIEIQTYFGATPLKAIYVLFRDNFTFDFIGLFTSGTFTIYTLFAPQLLSWLFVGFISGAIAKGFKRGLMTGFIVVLVDILLWIVFGIFAQEDMFNLFTDTTAISTYGGIVSGIIGGLIGGSIGGAISGPYEGL
jgi:hypothetical protein